VTQSIELLALTFALSIGITEKLGYKLQGISIVTNFGSFRVTYVLMYIHVALLFLISASYLLDALLAHCQTVTIAGLIYSVSLLIKPLMKVLM